MHAFWDDVWNAHDPDAVDRYVVDDFVIVSGGETITGQENFKARVRAFLTTVDGLHLEVRESFQNADGSRVASRWLLTGRNNGVPGTAVWAVREDGKLLTNWVDRSAWELSKRLSANVTR